MVGDHFLVLLTLPAAKHAHQWLYICWVLLQLLVEEAFNAESKFYTFALHVDLFRRVIEVFLCVRGNVRICPTKQLDYLDSSID